MPFKSRKQRAFMFAKHPDIARKWAEKYGVPKKLPLYAKRKKNG